MIAWPPHIVIAGGGTAGWLAALVLSDAIRREGHDTRLTVIESSKLGTIGVGEGSTAVFRQMMRHLGLSETEFLRETGATIKYGIRHRDWRRVGHQYDGPIDDPNLVAAGAALDTYAVAAGRPVGEAHLFQHLMTLNRAPVARAGDRLIPAGPFHHAFHFDQARAGTWLRKNARGVATIDDQITGVIRSPKGIATLKLESGQTISADFFIDCTGFRRALHTALEAAWISYSDILPVNRAMPFWVDLRDDEEIAPVTLAWAQKSGWMWQIPTQERYGMGYVYSDAHTTPEAAKAEIEAALGHEIHPRNDIRIDAGRQKEAWIGNCVALGLSSSFLEPLEATSIHGTIVQLQMLVEWLADPQGRALYNGAVARQVDDFRDFIRLHYVSERRDSPFWNDVAATHPDWTRERLALWAERLPEPQDFPAFPLNLPHLQGQLHIPVLDGLGLLDRDAARRRMASDPAARNAARSTHASLVREYAGAARACLPHRQYLQTLAMESAA